MRETRHARLSELGAPDERARVAADQAADAGGSPRAQIDAARAAVGDRLVYRPHQGSRERARRAARLAKGATP